MADKEDIISDIAKTFRDWLELITPRQAAVMANMDQMIETTTARSEQLLAQGIGALLMTVKMYSEELVIHSALEHMLRSGRDITAEEINDYLIFLDNCRESNKLKFESSKSDG